MPLWTVCVSKMKPPPRLPQLAAHVHTTLAAEVDGVARQTVLMHLCDTHTAHMQLSELQTF